MPVAAVLAVKVSPEADAPPQAARERQARAAAATKTDLRGAMVFNVDEFMAKKPAIAK